MDAEEVEWASSCTSSSARSTSSASTPQVWAGFKLNLELMIVAEAFVLALALLVAIVRGLPGRAAIPLRGAAIAYTDIFRGTPLILVLLWWRASRRLNYVGLSAETLFRNGVIALVLVYTAYVTEVYRAGIESVHPSQRMAARSLGLSYMQTMRYVVLPQAIRRVIPPLLNDFIGLQKDTALVTIIGADGGGRAGRASTRATSRTTRPTPSRRSSSSSSRSRSRASPTTSSRTGSGESGRRPYEHERPLRLPAGRHEALRRPRGPARRSTSTSASTTSSA